MVDRIARVVALALIVTLMAACQGSEELPTLVATAAPISQLPTPTPALAEATETRSLPTVTASPSATPVILTPSPTPLSGLGINITSPAAESVIVLGEEIVVSGLAQTGNDNEFSLSLISATGRVLDQVQPDVNDFNSWQATLTAPHMVSGRAEVRAQLVDKDGAVLVSDNVPVMLQVNQESVDRFLTLDRPQQAHEAVAGFNVFFDGLAQLPVDNLVTISLWDEACQNRVARQTFRLRGSGYWQGFVVVPRDAAGQLCAVAHFGQPESDSWREAQVQIEVLPPEDRQALGVLIGNPPSGREVSPGKSLLLYGTAYNAPQREVLVSILLENGRLLTEGVAAADIYGYWELELFIPASASGPAQIEASVGERGTDEYAFSTAAIHISER